MNGLRHQLLAGARLTPDEHRRRGRRRLLDDPVERSNPRAVADDPPEARQEANSGLEVRCA